MGNFLKWRKDTIFFNNNKYLILNQLKKIQIILATMFSTSIPLFNSSFLIQNLNKIYDFFHFAQFKVYHIIPNFKVQKKA